MARALNATGRPVVYSCSWPAYQGGLPPEVWVFLSFGKFPCSLCPGGALAGAPGAGCCTPLNFSPLDVAAGPRGNVAFLPGTRGCLGVPIRLGDGSLWEEGSGVYPLPPNPMVWGWS